jgi:MFS transporter, UMF1 family
MVMHDELKILRAGFTKQEISWILYDVGNSAFVLVIMTTLMPIFFKEVAAFDMPDALSTAYWGFANSGAALILALLAPVLGAFADYQGQKIRFFTLFLAIGICFTLLLPFIGDGAWLTCLLFYVMARVGWAGANLFYDAFIVDVTLPDRMDRISAHGYAWGYIGGVIPFLMVIGLIISAADASQGLPADATRIGFVIVAVWWFVFTVPLLRNVRQRYFIPPVSHPVSAGFKRLWKTFTNIRGRKPAFLFLIAYFFYIDGVDTIIVMSAAYGRDLGFSIGQLIGVILFIQIIAFPFALVYGRLAFHFSPKAMLLTGIIVYSVITLLAFWLPDIAHQQTRVSVFWLIAFLVGSSMGGIQAISRSFFARLIPPECSAEFFGFYNMFGKFAAITGPFLMGFVGMLTGHSRWGVLSILLLFLVGAVLLIRVKIDDNDSTSMSIRYAGDNRKVGNSEKEPSKM